MPLYQVHHSIPIAEPQRRALAQAITTLHCGTFSAPSIFVNVTFHPVTIPVYVGGRPQLTNYILGHLRPRPNNAANLKHIVETLTEIWNQFIKSELSASSAVEKIGEGRLDDAGALHNVFLMEDIVAGAEQGFVLPSAGRDGDWTRENMTEFEKRAGNGDESMRVLVEEYKTKV